MLKPEQVPDEVVEAAARALRTFYSDEPVAVCDGTAYKAALAALSSGLAAWKGKYQSKGYNTYFENYFDHLVLPLPQEGGDE